MSNVTEENESKSNFNDERTLRARGGDPNDPDPKRRPTDPVGLSRSILQFLRIMNMFEFYL